ncbi:TIGR03618 family F420-dependent PPOX class oxidoreductase [Nocardioides anomalus]|uniref:TIGR03618 family F420-dependent PPOX class oxidoreductase n=1 Tax=Nocardioides anomalus TaxID=2712223 RepID=A0A6G6W9W9_9ACTN|nr:TIGR03618 family F420-dependent PPOX class oxidoreductase [Nocardioides anomalus]QIG41999.1 TIGR03618 family F420-dependent PPOX class oxidoreductase [Nocardioides anomalus]
MLATLLEDGQPAAQVMWVDNDGECVLINTERHRKKFRNVQRDPRVTVTVWEKDNPYSYGELRGVVEEIVEGAAAREHIDVLSERYFGRPYKADQIESERVLLRIRPLRDGGAR